jgi:hypothetical protein
MTYESLCKMILPVFFGSYFGSFINIFIYLSFTASSLDYLNSLVSYPRFFVFVKLFNIPINPYIARFPILLLVRCRSNE